jgi:hypothetical protein
MFSTQYQAETGAGLKFVDPIGTEAIPERNALVSALVREVKELAISVGKGWFAAVISFLFGVYGAVELVAHSNASGWAWIAGGFAVMLLIALSVAHQALKARNAALKSESASSSVIIQGGEHTHYYYGKSSGSSGHERAEEEV